MNTGWSNFKSAVGRVTMGKRLSQIQGSFAPVVKPNSRRWVVQKCDLNNRTWIDATIALSSEGLAQDVMEQMQEQGGIFRLKEV